MAADRQIVKDLESLVVGKKVVSVEAEVGVEGFMITFEDGSVLAVADGRLFAVRGMSNDQP